MNERRTIEIYFRPNYNSDLSYDKSCLKCFVDEEKCLSVDPSKLFLQKYPLN